MPRITYQKKQNDAVSVQSLVLIFLANPMHLEVLFYICLNSLCVGLHLLSISDILCFFTLHDGHLLPKAIKARGDENRSLLTLNVGKENHPNPTSIKLN